MAHKNSNTPKRDLSNLWIALFGICFSLGTIFGVIGFVNSLF